MSLNNEKSKVGNNGSILNKAKVPSRSPLHYPSDIVINESQVRRLNGNSKDTSSTQNSATPKLFNLETDQVTGPPSRSGNTPVPQFNSNVISVFNEQVTMDEMMQKVQERRVEMNFDEL
ncbi:unnamed protein product [Cyberlindnera jadinii]|uniref:Uncharacterized protein n=1 Tax=Cyberlindnera jadinii (strain ATCC 18201 / CBS 1600 / BCRC 20928 / JCM 3617 / NBRC 0987 / NRRL Y-1542) TaxID=983966 RepID=A0A0H5C1Y6_CYBJN|nr:unnamed protein product [Cyberlindnera jadinii]